MNEKTNDLTTLTPEELAERVTSLTGWPFAGERVVLDRIPSGLTNLNWRLDLPDSERTFFLKVPGPGTEAFISRDAAHTAAVVAAETGVGPGVVYFDPETGVEVSAFLDGYRSATAWDLVQPESAIALMGLYRRLHTGALLPLTKTIFDMIDEHLANLAASDRTLRPWHREVLDRWAPIQAAWIAAGIDLVPGHNDMQPSNFMLASDGSMMLIDYDYASNNDRAYEIGAITGLYLIEADVQQRMLEEYFGGPPAARDLARCELGAIAADINWGLWGLMNAHVRDSDFDFENHGAARFFHAWQKLEDPRLPGWVSAL